MTRSSLGSRSQRLFVITSVLTIAFGFAESALFGEREPSIDLPQSLRLVPDKAVLSGVGASQKFLVVGTFADGIKRDLTERARFVVSDVELAELRSGAQVSALADGELVLSAAVGALTAKAQVQVVGMDRERKSSFVRDVVRILTRHGCNSTDCHGGVKGKGGLKLSVNGVNPRSDYEWIVQGGVYQVTSMESGGPRESRVDLAFPAESLLLQKATRTVRHGGGERFDTDSTDYARMADWLRDGAPYGDERERIESIEVFPALGVLQEGSRHGILVTARFADGRREDISDSVRFDSGNREVVDVDDAGVVRAVASGETSVLVHAAGHSASARFGVISEPLSVEEPVVPNNFIDEFVFAKLEKLNIQPSRLADDAEFLRRVCLDLTGTLPPPDRVHEFLANSDPQKREKVIDVLLETQEYIDYWTFRFADLYRVSLLANGLHEHAWVYWQWVYDCVATNKPLDEIARERIAAQGFEAATRHYLSNGELPRAEDAMAEQFRVFMGRRLDCAQCHDHPYERWSQNQFWGLAAFYKRMTRTESGGFGAVVIYEDPKGPDPKFGLPVDDRRVIHPRSGEEASPVFLDGSEVSEAGGNFRAALADWMTEHPFFAEAAVNRMWSYLFHRGFVEPVDDFRPSNPATHPELLAALAEDFRGHGHDLKHLLRRITRSRTYQLTSEPNPSNESDLLNYSHHIPRPLDAEVLLDAISQVTGVPEEFENRAGGREPPGTRAIQIRIVDEYPSEFLTLYGRVNRLTVPERTVEPNLGQALHMLVGTTYTEKLLSEGSRLAKLVGQSQSPNENVDDASIIEELYLAALSRLPSTEERGRLLEMLRQRSSRVESLKSLLWALLTSREFAYNH